MNKHLATLVLACAAVSYAGVSVAQEAMPTPGQRERLCAGEARDLGLTGEPFDAYMNKCTRIPAASSPPAQPPGAAPPPQPAAAAPLSPWAISCNKKVRELGLSGAQAKSYLKRCLARG
jgi:hypothetical protein